VAHANDRLTFHGSLLVRRVVFDRRPVAHVAAELGLSRQCAHRWVKRFGEQGWDGLHDRSSRPLHCPRRTPAEVEERVLAAQLQLRAGPDQIARVTGVPARTICLLLKPRLLPAPDVVGEMGNTARPRMIRRVPDTNHEDGSRPGGAESARYLWR
jgi:hypothetical protein